jgi:hypothetical protein
MRSSSAFAAAALVALTGSAIAAEPTAEDVRRSFHPYEMDGVPELPGYAPGVTLNASNYGQYEQYLPAGLRQYVRDGWYEIPTRPTTSFALSENYQRATLENLGKTRLGEKPGELVGFVAGRPFPHEPDPADPRAGEKLAWNYKYGYNWGDSAAITPFYWNFRNLESGALERRIRFSFHFLNFMHRVDQEPIPEITPNPGQMFRAIYAIAHEPFDVSNTQLLIYRYENDLKRDDSWLYLGFQRRVRRLATGQVTDSFLGTDLMIEDFEGYNGRISDYKWTYLDTVNVFLPFYYHNDLETFDEELPPEPDGYKYVAMGGQGKCFPLIHWQLRKAYRLQGEPLDPNHPLSKRVIYVDAQTFTLPYQDDYDRKGELWKTFIIGQAHSDHHLPKNKGGGVSIDDSASVIDVQARHCTAIQFKGQLDPAMSPPDMFTVQHLRATGR